MNRVVFGIDFGSRLSGNTVLCIFNFGRIHFMQVDKNVDADVFLLNAAKHFKPELVFIDAPLSLPGVYSGLHDHNDYHFRCADKDLKAMSPMFLGGLTARAIELKDILLAQGIAVKETFPRIMAKRMGLESLGYKGGKLALITCKKEILSKMNPAIAIDWEEINSWHALDALLSLMSALNYVSGTHKVYGCEEEGQIFV